MNYEIPYPGPTVSPAFDATCTSGCAVTTCSCTVPDNYWSSSSLAHGPANGWYVGFDAGFGYAGGKADTLHVRAVRGGS